MLEGMSLTIEEVYERRRDMAASAFARRTKTSDRLGMASLGAIVVTLLLLWMRLHGGSNWGGVGVLAVLTGVVLVFLARERTQALVEGRKRDLYSSALDRVLGETTQTGRTGLAFSEGGHLYERDLNVLGDDSLFGMLATTRTSIGQRALARMLLRPVDAPVVKQRQAAIQELAALTDLREQMGLLGRYSFEDVPAEDFENWLDAERSHFPRWPTFILPVLTLGWIALIVVGMVWSWDAGMVFRNVAVLLAIQTLLCWKMRPKVVVELESAQRLATQVEVLRAGVRVMRGTVFHADILRQLQQDMAGEDRALARLQQLLLLLEQRTKEWFFPVFLLTCGGTHLAMQLDIWKQRFDVPMRRWLDAWAEFEALIAIATYAAEHPKHVYPVILEEDRGSTAVFSAEGLWHPLLKTDVAVANDVELGSATQFLLISGSNMAGKSTLLRAMGANIVLASIGAPVAARSLRLGALRLGASITLSDSLAEGKSKFLAEVERLSGLVRLAKENPGQMLFLIDEVLSGTNSLDRRAAAESILRSLVAAGAVGAISTHDLTLTSIAEIAELHGNNVHMASADESDPLAFDYLLKAGINQTTNALAIVRMLGLG